MSTVTIPKKEYQELLDKKLRYEYLRYLLEVNIFESTPTRSRKTMLAELRATKKYNAKFLKTIRKGLARSSYFRA